MIEVKTIRVTPEFRATPTSKRLRPSFTKNMVTDPAPETISGAAAQVEKEAAEREAVASDAGKNATGLLNSMMSSLPHIPRSRDELVSLSASKLSF